MEEALEKRLNFRDKLTLLYINFLIYILLYT